MFTIDLLKGEGLPTKNRAQNMAVAVISSAVPVVIVLAMFGFYLQNKIIISIREGRIASYKTKTEKLSGVVAQQEAFERERGVYSRCLSEVNSAIGVHTQWSPVLATVVENMPESVVLTALEVKQHTVRKKIRQKDDPEKTVDVTIPVPTLRMSVSASPQSDSDKAIRDFRDKLRSSALLGPKLENITVSQKTNKLSGLEVVSYEINCLFKPQL
ncbi:MAG: hypothetical protein KAY65_13750 [Planctomycetes bacterium]|nr:hypothetical protein [Planctomycetota bacterium]